MLQVEQRPDPVERTVFIKTFPTWHGDGFDLLPALEAADDSAFRSGICCSMAAVSPDALGPGGEEDLRTGPARLVSEQIGRVYAQRCRIRAGAVESRLTPDRTHDATADGRPLVRQLDRHDDGLDPSRGVLDGLAGFGQGCYPLREAAAPGADHEAVLAGHAPGHGGAVPQVCRGEQASMRARVGRTCFPRRPTITRWST